MIRKGQIEGIAKGDVLAQNRVLAQVFRVAAEERCFERQTGSGEFLQQNRMASTSQNNFRARWFSDSNGTIMESFP